MKRFFLQALSIVIVFSVFAGCSSAPKEAVNNKLDNQTTNVSPNKSGGRESLTIWTNPEIEPFIKAVTPAYEKEHNIDIKIVGMDMVDADYKHSLDGPAGIGPDILYGPHNDVGDKSAQGLFAPLKISQKTMDSIVPSAIEATTFKDNLYILPDSMSTTFLIYNKDLVPNPPGTWDEMLSIIKDSKFDNKGDGSLGMLWNLSDFYFSAGILWAAGGYVFGDNNTNPSDIGLNSPGAVEGAKYIQQIYKLCQKVWPIKNLLVI
jgi:arabinogalactan oligomer/maltooligosaccharide transport system substrate-binding protein